MQLPDTLRTDTRPRVAHGVSWLTAQSGDHPGRLLGVTEHDNAGSVRIGSVTGGAPDGAASARHLRQTQEATAESDQWSKRSTAERRTGPRTARSLSGFPASAGHR